MKIDPTFISITALGVSIFSVIISSYRVGIDRRLQWEQLRGSMATRLTSRALELIALTEELRSSEENYNLLKKMIRILEGLEKIRGGLKRMETPPLFFTSSLMTKIAPIKSELDDTDPVFEDLRAAIKTSDFRKASATADGLIKRLYGTTNESS